jgi:hypothetical protein
VVGALEPEPGHEHQLLYDVSCVSAKSCTAVGFYTAPGVDKTWESWNAWLEGRAEPEPRRVWNFLYDVDCRTRASCTRSAGTSTKAA